MVIKSSENLYDDVEVVLADVTPFDGGPPVPVIAFVISTSVPIKN